MWFVLLFRKVLGNYRCRFVTHASIVCNESARDRKYEIERFSRRGEITIIVDATKAIASTEDRTLEIIQDSIILLPNRCLRSRRPDVSDANGILMRSFVVRRA